MYKKPPYADAVALSNKVIDFLISCGGPYKCKSRSVETNILLAIRDGNYILKENGAGIEYFASYMMIDKEEIDKVKKIDPAKRIPAKGEYMFVTECGCKKGMREIVKELRKRGKAGVCWNRIKSGFKNYPGQKGML